MRGVETTRYHVALDTAEADRPAADRGPGCGAREARRADGPDASFDADVWVGADGLVRRIRFSPGPTKEGRIVMQTELFDYGAEVHVEAPPPDEVFVPPKLPDLGCSSRPGRAARNSRGRERRR